MKHRVKSEKNANHKGNHKEDKHARRHFFALHSSFFTSFPLNIA